MSDLRKSTITTLEVAEMMEVEHSKILRKLEGDKNRKGYVQILTEAQMGVSDYFIPSTYRDASGKENKCYEVTKLGCDFLANKSTGEKGVLFTARYVKRFEKARTLPGEILANCTIPIDGLTVENGIPLINGLPVSNLSEGEKLDLCIDVALQNPNGLNIILIDGVEKLATDLREKLYRKCKEKGLQFIATRTTDDEDMTVVEL